MLTSPWSSSRCLVEVRQGSETVAAYERTETPERALAAVEAHIRFLAVHSPRWRGRFELVAGPLKWPVLIVMEAADASEQEQTK